MNHDVNKGQVVVADFYPEEWVGIGMNLFNIADANICCQAETPICKACHEGISVEEYLKKQLYKFIKTPRVNLCKKYHVLKGENSKEPDVRICLDNIKPPCNVISVGIAYNFIFDDTFT